MLIRPARTEQAAAPLRLRAADREIRLWTADSITAQVTGNGTLAGTMASTSVNSCLAGIALPCSLGSPRNPAIRARMIPVALLTLDGARQKGKT